MNADDLEASVHEEALGAGAAATTDLVDDLVRRRAPLLHPDAASATARRVLARMHGLGPIDDLLAEDDISDVLVNGPGPVRVERRGHLAATELVLGRDDVDRLVERIVTPLGLRADRRAPLVDARLPDGSRVHVVMPPLAVDGPYVAIRRFSTEAMAVEDFTTPDVAEFLVEAVRTRRNVIVVGGTGAGKTTLLNAMCEHLPPGERVVTIEDAAELRLQGDHIVRLEARPSTPDGLDAVTIRDLVRSSLRLRPDRLVVGEVRGGEALDMLQALNTGHDGCLSTCHANGPTQALRRLETMSLTAGVDLPLRAVRDQIACGVDLIVHVARTAGDRRRVVAVDAVIGDADDLSTRPALAVPQAVAS